MQVILLTLFLISQSFGFKVASYNVENLFDLHTSGQEYKEYIPNNKYRWNHENYNIKLKNIARVLSDINADVIALQEIESKKAMMDLLKVLEQEEGLVYKYFYITQSNSTIQNVLFSKYKFNKTKDIVVNKKLGYRNILMANLEIKGHELIIFASHWKSKWGKENKRHIYAKALKKEIDKVKNKDFIILGDLNSNYNEYITFKHNKKLNNTNGITGINHILKTIINNKLVSENIVKQSNSYLYNLWLEVFPVDRFSRKYFRHKSTPDAIILPQSLFNKTGINYIDNSFKVFRPSYLLTKNKSTKRWQRDKQRRHIGKGFSDHLPIYAKFTTNPFKDKQELKVETLDINYILKTKKIDKNFILKDIYVVNKTKYGYYLKDKSNKIIFVYKPKIKLIKNKKYSLLVSSTNYFKHKEQLQGISLWQKEQQ